MVSTEREPVVMGVWGLSPHAVGSGGKPLVRSGGLCPSLEADEFFASKTPLCRKVRAFARKKIDYQLVTI